MGLCVRLFVCLFLFYLCDLGGGGCCFIIFEIVCLYINMYMCLEFEMFELVLIEWMKLCVVDSPLSLTWLYVLLKLIWFYLKSDVECGWQFPQCRDFKYLLKLIWLGYIHWLNSCVVDSPNHVIIVNTVSLAGRLPGCGDREANPGPRCHPCRAGRRGAQGQGSEG